MRCNCCRGIVRWSDVVGSESKAEDRVEHTIVDEVAREGWVDVADFVECLNASFVEFYG